MCPGYGRCRVKAKGVTYERVQTDIGLYMRVHIIQRYDEREGGRGRGEERKGCMYIKSTGGPLLSTVLFL